MAISKQRMSLDVYVNSSITWCWVKTRNNNYCRSNLHSIYQSLSLHPRDGRFSSKVGQIGHKWDKSGAFSHEISVHLAPPRQMHWNLMDLSHLGPIWPTLEPNLLSLLGQMTHNRPFGVPVQHITNEVMLKHRISWPNIQ